MAETPNHKYNVPNQGAQDWHVPLNDNFEAFDTDVELRDSGAPDANGYSPEDGAKYLDTDAGVVYTADGSNWSAEFALLEYDDAAGTAEFGQTIVATGVEVDEVSGSVTGGTTLTDIAGTNLSIDSNGQLNASGSGGGGNWTANNNLLEPSDSNVDGIGVDEVNTSLLATGSDSVTVTVGGERTLELTAEGGNTAGNVLAGHSSNSLDSGVVGATISGGGYDDGSQVLPNTIKVNYGSIGGGFGNETAGDAATVAGGRENTSSDVHAAVGGGFSNTARGKGATVGGGEQNDVYDEHGTVGGGDNNQAGSDDGDTQNAPFATVSGGTGNVASGEAATVAGGADNEATGNYAFATGRNAIASEAGSFVVGDSSSDSVEAVRGDEARFQVPVRASKLKTESDVFYYPDDTDSPAEWRTNFDTQNGRFTVDWWNGTGFVGNWINKMWVNSNGHVETEGSLQSSRLKTESDVWYYPSGSADEAEWRTNYDDQNDRFVVDRWDENTGIAGEWIQKMWVTSSGDVKAEGSKDFVETVDTDDGEKEVHYTATESGTPHTEAAGVGELDDGRAEIELPDHFGMVTSDDEPLVVQTTPYGGTAGLKVVERSTDRLVVEDLDGEGGYEFAYTVTGTRDGYEDKQVIREPSRAADVSQSPEPADD